MFVSGVSFVGIGLCDELMSDLEKLYRARACVCACVCLDICLILCDLKLNNEAV
jgi:hypothetical protein